MTFSRYNKNMPDKSDEEIRKSIKKYEESLPNSERNRNVQEDVEGLIERAAKPAPKDAGTPHPDARYTERQTHSHTAEDTSD